MIKPTPHRSNRTRLTVLVAQVLTSAGMAAVGTAGGLLTTDVTLRPDLAALPLGMLVIGTGVGAPIATWLMSRHGRSTGLAVMYLAGAVGALGVLAGARSANVALMLTGNALMGAGNAAMMLTRFVLADLSAPHRRAESIGISLAAISIGAVLGPALLAPTADLGLSLAGSGAGGLYVVAVLALVCAPLVLTLSREPRQRRRGRSTPVPRVKRSVDVSIGGLAVLGTANLTMVGLMAMAPVHLSAHGHGLSDIGWIIGLHVAAMYVFAPLLGRITDRIGGPLMARLGSIALALVTAGIAFAPPSADAWVAVLLVLVGLFWSVQLVAGSSMIASDVRPGDRPKAEALGEIVMSVGAAFGSLVLAGPLVARGGLALFGVVCSALNLALLGLLGARRVVRGRGQRTRNETLIFLFSDIESSTRLAFEMGDRYAQILERHRHIIRAAITGRRGTVVDCEGDSVFAVFSDATDAVEAAIEAQLGLAAEEWPGHRPVLVRMGLHRGTALLKDGEVIGYAVHYAARVAASASGGQVLMTSDVAERISGSGPVATPIGLRQLKDLEGPTELHQAFSAPQAILTP